LFLIYAWPPSNEEHYIDYSTAHYRHISHTQKTWLLQLAFYEPSQSQLNRLQLNSSARTSLNLPNSPTSLLFSTPYIGSKFNNVSNTNSCLSPTKLFSLDNILISTAFSMFKLTVQLARLTSSPCNVLQFAHVSKELTGLLPTMLLYFGILYQTTPAAVFGASITRHYNWFYSSTCPLLASVSLWTQPFLFDQSCPPIVCLHQLLLVLWPLDLVNGFHLTVFSTLSFILTRSFTPVSVIKPLSYSCLAGFIQAFWISPLDSIQYFLLLRGAIIIIIFIIILTFKYL